MNKPFSNEQVDTLKDLMKTTFREAFDEAGVATKEDIKHLPTKDEFYTETARIYKKLDDLEVEKDILVHRVSKQGDDIERIKRKLKIASPRN